MFAALRRMFLALFRPPPGAPQGYAPGVIDEIDD